MRQIACFSGGKDSTAMILAMRERGDQIDGLLVTPTGNELAAVWEHWERVAAIVGAPVIRPPGPSLADQIATYKALPNFRQRWCTRTIKIVPAIAWAKRNPDATLCAGIRADEPAREGIIATDVPTRFPLREYGMGLCEVRAIIAHHGLTVPDRTDCAVCYHQRLGEWYELWRDNPERWAEGEALEAQTGRTFRSPGRDSWPLAMADMRAVSRLAMFHTVASPCWPAIAPARDGQRAARVPCRPAPCPTERTSSWPATPTTPSTRAATGPSAPRPSPVGARSWASALAGSGWHENSLRPRPPALEQISARAHENVRSAQRRPRA